MKYLIGYLTDEKSTGEEKVKERNEQIAIGQGCHGDVTKYWFGMRKHPERNEWGMDIPDSEQDKITAEEISALKTQEYVDADGWFPNPFPPQ